MNLNTIQISYAHALFDNIIINDNIGAHVEYQIEWLKKFINIYSNFYVDSINIDENDVTILTSIITHQINSQKLKENLDKIKTNDNLIFFFPVIFDEHAVSFLINKTSNNIDIYFFNTGDGCDFQTIYYGESCETDGIYKFVLDKDKDKNIIDAFVYLLLHVKSFSKKKFYGFFMSLFVIKNENNINEKYDFKKNILLSSSTFIKLKLKLPVQLSGSCSFRAILYPMISSFILKKKINFDSNNFNKYLDCFKKAILNKFLSDINDKKIVLDYNIIQATKLITVDNKIIDKL